MNKLKEVFSYSEATTEEEVIINAIKHFRNIVEATDTKEKYNEGFVDGLEFCISHLFSMLNLMKEG